MQLVTLLKINKNICIEVQEKNNNMLVDTELLN